VPAAPAAAPAAAAPAAAGEAADVRTVAAWAEAPYLTEPLNYATALEPNATPLQRASGARWQAGDGAQLAFMPTYRDHAVHVRAMQADAMSKAAGAADAAGLAPIAAAKPIGGIPEDMARVEPMASYTYEPDAPNHWERPAGTRPEDWLDVIDADAFLKLHRENCAACRASAPHPAADCYMRPVSAMLKSGARMGFKAPPVSGQAPKKKYDKAISDEVDKLVKLGVLKPTTEDKIKCFADPFLVSSKEEAILSPAATAAAEACPRRAAAVAAAVGDLLFTEYEDQREDGKPTLAAWDAAAARHLKFGAVRLVISPRGANASSAASPFAYEKLGGPDGFLAGLAPGAYMIKEDQLKGYYQVPLHPSEWHYFGVAVTNKDGTQSFYVFTRLPMGSTVSPAAFSLFSAAFHRLLREQGPAPLVSKVYLDDHFWAYLLRERAREALLAHRRTAAAVGARLSPGKCSTDGEQREALLGVIVDTTPATPSAGMPPLKNVLLLTYARFVALCAEKDIPVPRFVLERLGGRANVLSQLHAPLASRLRPLLRHAVPRGLAGARGRWYWNRDDAAATVRACNLLFARAAAGEAPSTPLWPFGTAPRATLYIQSDAASKNTVSVVTSAGSLLVVHFPDCEGVIIATLEALGAAGRRALLPAAARLRRAPRHRQRGRGLCAHRGQEPLAHAQRRGGPLRRHGRGGGRAPHPHVAQPPLQRARRPRLRALARGAAWVGPAHPARRHVRDDARAAVGHLRRRGTRHRPHVGL